MSNSKKTISRLKVKLLSVSNEETQAVIERIINATPSDKFCLKSFLGTELDTISLLIPKKTVITIQKIDDYSLESLSDSRDIWFTVVFDKKGLLHVLSNTEGYDDGKTFTLEELLIVLHLAK